MKKERLVCFKFEFCCSHSPSIKYVANNVLDVVDVYNIMFNLYHYTIVILNLYSPTAICHTSSELYSITSVELSIHMRKRQRVQQNFLYTQFYYCATDGALIIQLLVTGGNFARISIKQDLNPDLDWYNTYQNRMKSMQF